MASRLAVSLGLGVNLASAIGIVMLNKLIYVHYHFPSMTLTLVHFLTTSLCLQICVWLNIFNPKRLPVLRVLPLSASFCGFVVFTNLSLQFNTVGTYQLAKSMTTPVILFLQALVYSRPSSLRVRLTVVSMRWGRREGGACFDWGGGGSVGGRGVVSVKERGISFGCGCVQLMSVKITTI